jgi:hypothetical protein
MCKRAGIGLKSYAIVGKSLQVIGLNTLDRSDINRDLARIDDPSQSLKLGVHQIANSSQARHLSKMPSAPHHGKNSAYGHVGKNPINCFIYTHKSRIGLRRSRSRLLRIAQFRMAGCLCEKALFQQSTNSVGISLKEPPQHRAYD